MNAKRALLTAIAVTTVAIAFAAPAQAGVPFWARTFRRTKVPVQVCGQIAQSAIQSVVGGSLPTLTQLDSTEVEVRGFSANDGIFVYCTASPTNICPNTPEADVTIVTFSPANDAVTTLNQVSAAIGNPILLDCSP
jgi:hypothetical protein